MNVSHTREAVKPEQVFTMRIAKERSERLAEIFGSNEESEDEEDEEDEDGVYISDSELRENQAITAKYNRPFHEFDNPGGKDIELVPDLVLRGITHEQKIIFGRAIQASRKPVKTTEAL